MVNSLSQQGDPHVGDSHANLLGKKLVGSTCHSLYFPPLTLFPFFFSIYLTDERQREGQTTTSSGRARQQQFVVDEEERRGKGEGGEDEGEGNKGMFCHHMHLGVVCCSDDVWRNSWPREPWRPVLP